LPQSFFRRPVLTVAPKLLGSFLCVDGPEGVTRLRITEVEAYDGPEDRACHGARGLTPRTRVMFGPGGRWYVYFVYGMYWMLNIVTGDEGYPAAVLIRGAGEYDGPGKLTRGLGITGASNGLPAARPSGLWIEAGPPVPSSAVRRTPRIGVGYAGEWARKPYRFLLKPPPR
jgi:DNA-3-methyladenine glycosylase